MALCWTLCLQCCLRYAVALPPSLFCPPSSPSVCSCSAASTCSRVALPQTPPALSLPCPPPPSRPLRRCCHTTASGASTVVVSSRNPFAFLPSCSSPTCRHTPHRGVFLAAPQGKSNCFSAISGSRVALPQKSASAVVEPAPCATAPPHSSPQRNLPYYY